ncbi:MAG: Rpn family recombination-promoting nuclease/putative transposase [Ruminococcus sp.]|nr:Rpn family recombination-promoting nuclease/putative transposase [Ruminococcus sp.]
MSKKEIVKPKIDIVFKKLFGVSENLHILRAFLCAVLDMDKEMLEEIVIENNEIIPDFADEKTGRVDIKVTTRDKKTINVELQSAWYKNYKERSLFYWAKLFTYGFKKGCKYGELPGTICINIIDFSLFDCKEYDSCFTLLERRRNEEYNGSMALYFFELNKLPQATAENRSDPVLQWLRLIDAESEDELKMLEKSEIPEIRDAVSTVRFFSKDEQMRINAFEREMALLDRLAEQAEYRDDVNQAREEVKRAKAEAEKAREETEKAREETEKAKEETEKVKAEAEKEAINSITALMEKMNLTVDEAMDILDISANKREEYRKFL